MEKLKVLKLIKGDVPADLVVVSAGVMPNTDWLKGVVDLDQRGWIKTDPYLRTNVKDVYAIEMQFCFRFQLVNQCQLP